VKSRFLSLGCARGRNDKVLDGVVSTGIYGRGSARRGKPRLYPGMIGLSMCAGICRWLQGDRL